MTDTPSAPPTLFQATITPAVHMRYATVGDWLDVSYGSVVAFSVSVSSTSDWRYDALVAIHELVEAVLCKHAGVTQHAVDDFDFAFTGDGEPGDSASAPYYHQHQVATQIERMLASALNVDWDDYCNTLDAVEFPLHTAR